MIMNLQVYGCEGKRTLKKNMKIVEESKETLKYQLSGWPGDGGALCTLYEKMGESD